MRRELHRFASPLAVAAGLLLAAPSSPLEGEAIARRAPKRGSLEFEIVDATGLRIPGKLTLLGVGRTRKPRLAGRLSAPIPGGSMSFNRVFTTSGVGEIRLRAGTYEVTASRGIEWTTHRQRVVIGARNSAQRFVLRPAIDTRGWLATDLHVHGVRSTDSVTPKHARVQQLIADGVEFFTSSDHNTISDYESSVVELGASHLISSALGTEITTESWGHLVAFPLPAELAEKPRGAVLSRGRSGHDYIAAVRAASPESIIIAVHPHSRTSSYLKDGGLNTRRDRARPGFSWDFDALEILNGYHRFNFGRAIRTNLRRWFDLLDHGHLVAGVGSSDTHALRGLGGQGGYPRTYVRVPDDRPDANTQRDVVRGLKAQRALFTTGPFIDARIAGHGIGDVAPAPGGRALLEVRVQAAPWVPTNRLTIYVNGEVFARRAIAPSRTRDRLRARIPIEVTSDSHVVVRVDGRGQLSPVAGEHKHRIPILAVTNPIYLDVDGNRRYDPRKPHGHPVTHKRRRRP